MYALGHRRRGMSVQLIKYTKLTSRQVDVVLAHFAADKLATEAAMRASLSVRSVNRHYQALRERLIALGFRDMDVSDEDLDLIYATDSFQNFTHARRLRARGWQKRYASIHYEESLHRYIRDDSGPHSIATILEASLRRKPLGAHTGLLPLTYFAEDQAFSERRAAAAASSPFRSE